MKDQGFAIIYTKMMWNMTKALSHSEDLVFKYMVSNVVLGNMVHLEMLDIANACGLSRQSVSAAIKGLQKADLIARMKRSDYMINPIIIRKGENQHGEMSEKYQRLRRGA